MFSSLLRRRRRPLGTAAALTACATALVFAAGCGSGSGTSPIAPTTGGSVFAGQTVSGASRAVGNGTVHAFVKTNASGQAETVGLVLSRAALNNLPTTPTEFEIDLPQAGGHGYQVLGLDWNPNGHPAPGIYDLPHFDMHFYVISEATRQQITGEGTSAQTALIAPPPATVPTDYQMDVHSVVPTEGVHFEDFTSKEWNGQKFDTTMIFGFYGGKMAFLEPMITREFLLNNTTTTTLPIKQPAVYNPNVAFPTAYRVSYDAATGDTTITLMDLTKH